MTPVEIDQLLAGLRDARAAAVDDVSLFLCGQTDDAKDSFFRFWNDHMAVEFLALDPYDRGLFIWHLIENVLAGVHAIELGAGLTNSRLN